MAADVLMGHDPECGRWIRAQPRAAGRGRGRRPARNRRRAALAGAASADAGRTVPSQSQRPNRSSSSRRPAGAARSPRARPSWTPRARSASTSIRCAAAAASAAAARSTPADGSVPQARHHARRRRTSSPPGDVETRRTRDRDGLAAGPPPVAASRTSRGDVLIDVPPESQVHRQVVRKGLPVRDFVIDPVVRLHYVEVERPELASPSRRPRAPRGRAGARVGPRRPRGGPRR